jgi:hypothetical protein
MKTSTLYVVSSRSCGTFIVKVTSLFVGTPLGTPTNTACAHTGAGANSTTSAAITATTIDDLRMMRLVRPAPEKVPSAPGTAAPPCNDSSLVPPTEEIPDLMESTTTRRPIRRAIALVAVAAATLLTHADSASGHASVPAAPAFGFAPNTSGGTGALNSTPPYAPNAFTTVTLRVPFEQTALFNGSADTTVDLRVIVPAGWTNPMCGPAKTQINNTSTNNTNQPGPDVAGWSCEILDEAGHKVLHWSGPQVVAPSTEADSAQFFVFSVTTPAPAVQTTYDGTNGTEGFIVDQEYASGEIVRWIPNAAFPGTPPPGAETEVATGLVRTVAGPGTYFHSLDPLRLLDSRTSTGGWNGPLASGSPQSLTVTGGSTGVPTNAVAVVVNVTATGPTADSYLTVHAAGTGTPNASLVNFAAGQTRANLGVVRVGTNGQITFVNSAGSTHVIVDLVGYFDGVAADRYNPLDPTRLLDSRGTLGGWNAKLGAGETRALAVRGVGGVSNTADAVLANVTVTSGSADSFLTAFPAGTATPLASNVNFTAGQTVANLVAVKLGTAGDIALRNDAGSVDVIVDVVGYFDTSTGSLFHPLAPGRILDSRTAAGGWSSPLDAGAPRTAIARGVGGVGTDATAVIGNLTVTGTTADSFLTGFPAGANTPLASNLNFTAGQTVANLAAIKIGTGGQVALQLDAGSTHVIVDVAGFFANR